MIKAKRFYPEAVVSFSTEKGDLVVRAKAEKEGTSIDSSVLSISTNNDLNADAATFQIQLNINGRWDEILASNDLVWICMRRNESEKSADKSTVMVGLIDDVRRNVSIQGGTPQRVITVTGRSFAKALINFEIGTVQEVEVALNAGWLLDKGITFAQQSSHEIVEQIMEKLVFKYMNYQFRNGNDFKGLTVLNLSSRAGEKLFDQTSFVNFQGSIWSFIREIINEPFNQVYWECYGKPTMVVRETPFNPKNWNALPLHTVTDEDVVIDNYGRSDIETYTLFSVGVQSFFSSFDINRTFNVFPYWYEPYFKKYGLRRLNRFTAYVGFASEQDKEDASKLQAYQRDLFNWNINNPDFYNGYLLVRGECKYKVGDRLLYKSKENRQDMEFFIEGVSHDFVNFGYWTTRLTVTRGVPNSGADRFGGGWDKFSTYQGGSLGTPSIPKDPAKTGADTIGPILFPPGTASGMASNVIDYAEQFIGKVTYKYGRGRNESDISDNIFDCSSFVRYVFSQNGIDLGPMDTTNTDTLATKGAEVKLSEIRPGDLIFFNTVKYNGHVGIYLGQGKFIGAQEKGVNIQDVQWWADHYGVGSIRRVFMS